MANIKEFNSAIETQGKVASPRIFVADSENDVSSLPTGDFIAWGSFAICLENAKIYILRESGTWEEFTA